MPSRYDLAGACWTSRDNHHSAVGKVCGHDLLEDAGLVEPPVLGCFGHGRPQLPVGRLGRNTPDAFSGAKTFLGRISPRHTKVFGRQNDIKQHLTKSHDISHPPR